MLRSFECHLSFSFSAKTTNEWAKNLFSRVKLHFEIPSENLNSLELPSYLTKSCKLSLGH
ncbi:CLUMA_CG016742, isoform A [Clunio marinus]|uniref:CLUMA_CG016742, isoform A n=1 Tax=Clunio marinus TaxID=568069 RepID=A0A1J1IS05_9DIPT|nr:CLUMA_CG016742, isoform A [Clunio marinus]